MFTVQWLCRFGSNAVVIQPKSWDDNFWESTLYKYIHIHLPTIKFEGRKEPVDKFYVILPSVLICNIEDLISKNT